MSNTFSKNSGEIFRDYVTLDKADLNTVYVIRSCNLPQTLQTRFAELGFIVGAKLTVTKIAPLGDPLEIKIMGYSLCARASELKQIVVERCDNE